MLEYGYPKPQPKPFRWQSKKYQDFIREKPCVFCYLPNHSQFHHLRQFSFTGFGTKPSDSYGVPACPDCHEKDQKFPCKDGWLAAKCIEFLTQYIKEKGVK